MSELFRDPRAPLAERARDLLDRLDPSERIALLHQAAPAIPRLGIGPFRTGCEALHGVAWLGEATVFPQPVGLAASWDPDLIRRVGEVAAIEVRAKRSADPLVSLNAWAPVVNTLRHPAWGRNEEGYSEDPHLTGLFGAAYARGMRGDHPTVWRTVPTLKHFLAYSNETDRSATSSEMSARTLHEEELPAFRAAIEGGHAGAVMLAYNRVNGIPAHTQPELIAEARSWASESIAFVSDAGAPTFLVTIQGSQPDDVHAAAALVTSGMDSFTDNDADAQPTIDAVTEALARGLLTADDIDRAALRLLELRIRTGEFDGDDDPYRGITLADIGSPEARALAREAAGAGVVLLRNDDGVLPLRHPSRIAVVGPLADLVLTDWYSGTPCEATGLGAALRERYPSAQVDVVTGADTVTLRARSTGRFVVADPGGERVRAVGETAGEAGLFDVTDWTGGILTLRSHASGRLLTGGSWPLRADATRVGGWVVQETFRAHEHPDGSWSLLHLGSGRWVRVVRDLHLLAAEAVTLEEAERFEVDVVVDGLEAARASAGAADLAIVAVGNDPHLDGRETQDRPGLDLPASAVALWNAVAPTGTPAVLSISSSYPYILAGASDAATVVWSSHGGQEHGRGLVDVLSGDREPLGRLAQSWPADAAQAGDLFDYDTLRQQATYRHQPGASAFPFGHGLGYGDVAYTEIAAARDRMPAPPALRRHPAFVPADGETPVRVTVRVRNAGSRPAEELVQLYVLPAEGAGGSGADGARWAASPRRLLVAFARTRLAPGEERDVELTFALERLAVWEETPGGDDHGLHAGALRVRPGAYVLASGPSSQDLRVRAALTVDAHA